MLWAGSPVLGFLERIVGVGALVVLFLAPLSLPLLCGVCSSGVVGAIGGCVGMTGADCSAHLLPQFCPGVHR